MKHDYKVQTVLERGGGCTFDWKGEGVSWGVGSNPGRSFFFFFFFFLLTQNAGIVRLGMCERVIS